MRQLIQSYRTGEMRLEEVPPPAVRPGGVLVRTVRSLVSAGTEKMIVDLARKSLLAKARARPDLVRKVLDSARRQGVWNTLRKVQSKLDTPIPLGYSSAGVVVEVGEGVHEVRVGDRVACAGAGYANHADYNYVPRNLLARLPAGVSMEAGAFATVAAIALQGVRQAQPTLGERVAVLGLGLIGQLTVQQLRANGCRVLGFDPDAARARLAEELGAHQAVASGLEEAALRFSDGEGMDAVIIAASSPSSAPIAQAGEISRLRGRVVVVGLVGMEVDRSLYYRKELDLRLSMSYGPGRYDPDFEERGFDYPIAYVRWTEQRNLSAVLELMADGALRVDRLVTHRFGIERALEAYELIAGGGEPYLGVLLEYGAEDATDDARAPSLPLRREPKAKERLGIGVIGAGAFAQGVLLPALQATGEVDPIAIATASGATARRIGERHGFRVATASADEVLAHPDVDAVFVLTRHDLHAPLVVRALEAGKHVFVEKPLALSRDELAAVAKAHEGSRGGVLVGFNRRFSPLVEALAAHFAQRSSPLVMLYRVNAGFLPREHWVHDPVEGGGRILGEVCHFVDLLHHLAGAPPVRVSAECIASAGRFRGDDNAIATLRFADGSIGTIAYTAAGDERMPKERLEVFGDGGVALLEDFRTLDLSRAGRRRRERSPRQDKGFAEEMRRFLAAIRTGGPMPIPFEALLASSLATLGIVESLRSGEAVTVTPLRP
jgi:predicted dehydrogenase